jgi:hypothetical protein
MTMILGASPSPDAVVTTIALVVVGIGLYLKARSLHLPPKGANEGATMSDRGQDSVEVGDGQDKPEVAKVPEQQPGRGWYRIVGGTWLVAVFLLIALAPDQPNDPPMSAGDVAGAVIFGILFCGLIAVTVVLFFRCDRRAVKWAYATAVIGFLISLPDTPNPVAYRVYELAIFPVLVALSATTRPRHTHDRLVDAGKAHSGSARLGATSKRPGQATPAGPTGESAAGSATSAPVAVGPASTRQRMTGRKTRGYWHHVADERACEQ